MMSAVHEGDVVEVAHVHPIHAASMFLFTLVYLGVLAVVVQWWNAANILEHDSRFTGILLATIWVPFILEALVGFLLNRQMKGIMRRFFLVSLVPPLRLGYSTFNESHIIWLPTMGWRKKNRVLFEHLDQKAAIPMLVIALMILPLLGVEFLLKEKVEDLPWLSLTLNACAAFIWFAFALEYVLMVSIAEDKLDYCKKHWLNLLIILLPLIAFLRGFQVVRPFRVARAGKLLRVYRMRGLLIRVSQALVALSAIERLFYRNPEKHLLKLEKLYEEKEREIKDLREKMDQVRERLAQYRAQQSADTESDN